MFGYGRSTFVLIQEFVDVFRQESQLGIDTYTIEFVLLDISVQSLLADS